MRLRFALMLAVAPCLFAAPAVSPIGASPSQIQTAISTAVTFTAQLSGGTVAAGGVNLLQLTASGGSIGILGVIHDDGQNGDGAANDGIYTLVAPLTPAAQTTAIYLQVSAAFKGVLLRVKSPVLTLPVVGTGGSPTITDFKPKSGPVGTVVNATLNGFTPVAGSIPQVNLPNTTGGSIAAPVSTSAAGSVSFVVPDGAAAGNFSVTVGADTASSPVSFRVTTSSTFTLSVGPQTATLLQGQSVTYAVTASSNNGFNGLAALTVTGLPTGVTSSFRPPAITAGQTSILTLTAPTGQPVGSASLTVSATASVEGQSISQTATVGLQIVAVTTSFLARTVVDDRLQTPISGVTVKFTGKDASNGITGCLAQAVSDSAGNVSLTDLPSACVGPQLIAYDGSTATSPAGKYAGVNLSYTLVGGQATTSPILIHLPRIDNGETVQVQQNSPTDQTFTFQSIPGLLVTVYAGTKFSLEDGSQPDPFPLVAISIPLDRLPDKMAASNMVMPFIVAFQPANAVASQPVAVNFPNPLNIAPNSHATLMTLDPTRGFMVPYGTATVSTDGNQFIADADPKHQGRAYGLVHFDWHGVSTSPPGSHPCHACPCAGTNSPIDFQSALEVLNDTDIGFGGSRGAISVVRTYRSLSSNPGPFGIGTNHNFSYELDTINAPGASPINLLFPDGTAVPFFRRGTPKLGLNHLYNQTLPAFLGVVMTTNSDGTTDLRWKDGTIWHFIPLAQPVNSGSFLASITDPNGNATTITRDTSGQHLITQITDPVGRSLNFAYDGASRITSITDPIGRKVQYNYNNQGTLAWVTDLNGYQTQYDYDPQNRLTKITDARNTVTVQNQYDGNGLVVKQTLADGGTTTFNYLTAPFFCEAPCVVSLPIIGTVVTDPMGHATTYTFDAAGFVQSVTDATGATRQFTRDSITNQVTAYSGTGTCRICGNTRRGNQSFTYDEFGNVTSQTDSLGNTTAVTYEPSFNKIATITDPLGKVTHFNYDLRGNLISQIDANNNATTFRYDSFGQLTQITDALHHTTTLDYD